MIKLGQLLAIVVTSFWLAPSALAAESISSFDVELFINEDASVDISEHIEYNFGDAQSHGILRTIPISYKARGGNYKLDITNISVSNGSGVALPHAITKPGRDIKIKIGDADEFVTGKQKYVIQYNVSRAINYFDDHQELYWNVTGNEWPVPINSATATISLTVGAPGDQTQAICFAGRSGSTESCKGVVLRSGEPASWLAVHSGLTANEGMTIALSMPNGTVSKPTKVEWLTDLIFNNLIIGVPLLTLGIMSYLWQTRGRDPKGRGAIPAQYDPPEGLTPAEVGTIVDERVDQIDFTAEIIFLAVNGYLKVNRIEEKKLLGKKVDYRFDKLKEGDSLVKSFEQDLLDKLFDDKSQVKLSDLKNSFASDLQMIKAGVYRSVVNDGYFPRNPQHTQAIYIGSGIAMGFIGGFISALLGSTIGAFSFGVTGIIIVIFGVAMPVRTKQGVLAREHILGLKRYLSMAEKDRLAFHNAPEKNPEQFDKLLPFAMVLKVEKQWAKQFESMHREEPSWYNGGGRPLVASALASDMRSFSSTAGATMASTASSGGSGFSGGFSGGGFGGGGGRSW